MNMERTANLGCSTSGIHDRYAQILNHRIPGRAPVQPFSSNPHSALGSRVGLSTHRETIRNPRRSRLSVNSQVGVF